MAKGRAGSEIAATYLHRHDCFGPQEKCSDVRHTVANWDRADLVSRIERDQNRPTVGKDGHASLKALKLI
jgi:hypothetical protein